MKNFRIPNPMKSEDISNSQCEDLSLSKVYIWLSTAFKPSRMDVAHQSAEVREYSRQLDTMYLKNKCIFRTYFHDDERSHEQLLVPEKLRKEVFYYCHDHPSCGHLGIEKTLDRVMARFYWYNFKHDVETYIKGCTKCEAKRGGPTKPQGKLSPNKAGFPFQRLAFDLVGPLPKTSRGNNHILTITDKFSGWLECWPIKDITAHGIARVVVDEFTWRSRKKCVWKALAGTMSCA